MPKKRGPRGRGPRKYVTKYRHYRTGKIMYAKDYGYRAWPIGLKK